MSKIIVIGGGASGLVAAITSARNNHDVTILEKNNTCGKKILITGNGKCNYWNEDQEITHYHSSSKNILEKIITPENKNKVLNFFSSIGIIPKIKDSYYYPYSNLAATIQYALIKEAEISGVKIIENYNVEKVIKKDNKFIINDDIECDKLIISTGSKAAPKTGDGMGYSLVKSFGHTIVPVLPALTQLVGNESYFKLWNGIRTQANVSLYIDNKIIKEETGELQLTDYGISGICVFNLSRYASIALYENKKVSVNINLAPWFKGDIEDFIIFMNNRNKNIKNRKMYELFEGFLNYKLVDVIFKVNKIDKENNWDSLTEIEKKKISTHVLAFPLNIIDTNSFDKAQVCSGGVSLEEINPNTMESKLVDGLYIIGELLDVDGDCGGYNLGFAWMSGMIAGENIKDD